METVSSSVPPDESFDLVCEEREALLQDVGFWRYRDDWQIVPVPRQVTRRAPLGEWIAEMFGAILGFIVVVGAGYLTYWRWDVAWPCVLIPAVSWLLVCAMRRYVIQEAFLFVAVPSSLVYGLIGAVLLVMAA
jgi:hypothetical protein